MRPYLISEQKKWSSQCYTQDVLSTTFNLLGIGYHDLLNFTLESTAQIIVERGCQGNFQVLQEREHVRRLVCLLWWFCLIRTRFLVIWKAHKYHQEAWSWFWLKMSLKLTRTASERAKVCSAKAGHVFFFIASLTSALRLSAHHNGLPDATWKGPLQLVLCSPRSPRALKHSAEPSNSAAMNFCKERYFMKCICRRLPNMMKEERSVDSTCRHAAGMQQACSMLSPKAPSHFWFDMSVYIVI